MPSLYAPFSIFHLLVSPSFLMCYAQCCHGNGSGVRHVHMLYYQATVLDSSICLTFIVAMAMVVMGDTCITAIHTNYVVVPEAICCCHLLLPWRWL